MEIQRLLDIFGATIERLAARSRPVEFVLPTTPRLEPRIRQAISGWAVKPRIVVDAADKWAAFRTARAALAASGTVTLELALAGVPMIAAYRLSLIEELVVRITRTHKRLKSVILANLVLGENIVPEFIQRDCTPPRLADALEPLLSNTPQRRSQIEAFARLDAIMSVGTTTPSVKAAAIVLDVAQRGRRNLLTDNALLGLP